MKGDIFAKKRYGLLLAIGFVVTCVSVKFLSKKQEIAQENCSAFECLKNLIVRKYVRVTLDQISDEQAAILEQVKICNEEQLLLIKKLCCAALNGKKIRLNDDESAIFNTLNQNIQQLLKELGLGNVSWSEWMWNVWQNFALSLVYYIQRVNPLRLFEAMGAPGYMRN